MSGSGTAAIDDEMATKLQPIIQKRMDAWPEKGINLQLAKRVDQSVSVDDWLKANQESTTTSKKYKKIVVNEENKTTITTTKHTKTTTKRSTFSTFRMPGMLTVNSNAHHQQIHPYHDNSAEDIVPAADTKWKDKAVNKSKKEQATSVKDAGKVNKLPVKIELSKLPNVIRSKLTKRYDKEPLPEHLADPPIIEKAKQPTKRAGQKAQLKETEIKSKSKKKVSPPVVLPPVDEGNQRCLRSRSKKISAVLPVPDEKSVSKPTTKTLEAPAKRAVKTIDESPKLVKTAAQKNSLPSKAKSKKPNQQLDLPAPNRKPMPSMPYEKKAGSTHRSRSPLREKTNQIETGYKLVDVRVHLKRLKTPVVTTSRSPRIQPIAQPIAEVADFDTTANRLPDVQAMEIADMTTEPSAVVQNRLGQLQKTLKENKRERVRPKKTLKENKPPRKTSKENAIKLANRHRQHDPAIGDPNTTTSTGRQLRNRSIQLNNPLQSTIVVHSPSYNTTLGTKINDTMMVVTQNDYKKCINPKYARNTSLFKRNILPIDRRIIYQPPMLNISADVSDYDSESDDVLVTSYMHTGRFVQIKV